MRILLSVLLVTLLLLNCTSSEKERPTTALDTGREFIRASLDGNFDIAEGLLLKDSQNMQLFSSYKLFFDKMAVDKKRSYKSSSYTINKLLEVDDSTTLINYSNSYMNQPLEIKVIHVDKDWQVDFKHTYSGNPPL